ncbi:MAG: hypothetical protein ACTTJM_00165 [Bergeyella cardium]
MKQVTKKTAGKQIVVFDNILDTYPGGVHIDPVEAKKRFTDGVIPAGTALVPATDGKFKPLNEALTAANLAGCIGLTAEAIAVDDFPLVACVLSGIARKEALPDKEKTGVAFLKTALPRISFV